MKKHSPVLYVLLGLLVGFLAAEAVVQSFFPSLVNGWRVFDYMESERGKFCRYDDLLGWNGKPNAADHFEWADCRVFVRQNRYGHRGSEYDIARTATPRFVVLGDSFVWGFGVEEEEIFTRVMEQQSASPIEAVNMGVSGFGTDQELLLWRRTGRFWKPDHVLLCLTPANDLHDISSVRQYGYEKPAFQLVVPGKLELVNVPVPPRTDWDEPQQEIRKDWRVVGPRSVRRSPRNSSPPPIIFPALD